jgi:hypothetical protein
MHANAACLLLPLAKLIVSVVVVNFVWKLQRSCEEDGTGSLWNKT